MEAAAPPGSWLQTPDISCTGAIGQRLGSEHTKSCVLQSGSIEESPFGEYPYTPKRTSPSIEFPENNSCVAADGNSNAQFNEPIPFLVHGDETFLPGPAHRALGLVTSTG
jgi:hypothetical protein